MAVVAGVVSGGVTVMGTALNGSSPRGIKGVGPVETGCISGGVELESEGTSGGDDTCGIEDCLTVPTEGRGEMGCTVGGDITGCVSGGVID